MCKHICKAFSYLLKGWCKGERLASQTTLEEQLGGVGGGVLKPRPPHAFWDVPESADDAVIRVALQHHDVAFGEASGSGDTF